MSLSVLLELKFISKEDHELQCSRWTSHISNYSHKSNFGKYIVMRNFMACNSYVWLNRASAYNWILFIINFCLILDYEKTCLTQSSLLILSVRLFLLENRILVETVRGLTQVQLVWNLLDHSFFGFSSPVKYFISRFLMASQVELVVQNTPAHAGDSRAVVGLIHVGKIPCSRKWYSLQLSCLENFTERRAWWATVHGVAKSRTQLSTHTYQGFSASELLTFLVR